MTSRMSAVQTTLKVYFQIQKGGMAKEEEVYNGDYIRKEIQYKCAQRRCLTKYTLIERMGKHNKNRRH